MQNSPTFFAPELYIESGIRDIGFYTEAFNAVELRRWSNEDGTLHVAELSIDGALFHVHEESAWQGHLEPKKLKGSTTLIGLFVPDVDAMMKSAIKAGATEISPAQDYDYGYRQGQVRDPFGHYWQLQKKI